MSKYKLFRILTMTSFIALMIIMNIFAIPLSAEENRLIKVGIIYQNNAINSVPVESNAPLNLEKNGTKIWELPAKIIVKKDGFYDINRTLIVPSGYTTGDYVQPYHVEVGSEFASEQDAKIASQNLNFEHFVVYDGVYRIFSGSFATLSEAQNHANQLRNIFPSGYLGVSEPSASRIIVTDESGKIIFGYDSNLEIIIKPVYSVNEVPYVKFDGKRYRGGVEFRRNVGSDLTVINILGLEEYLFGVVPLEMSGGWNTEALKAQAVAARGYTMTLGSRFAKLGFDICNTTSCQVYGGLDAEHNNSTEAVLSTAGLVMKYDGKAIEPYYSANSGGVTDNSEEIWSAKLGYIRAVFDPYSIEMPTANWTESIKISDLNGALQKRGKSVGNITKIEIISRTTGGRVSALKITGTSGTEVFTKETVRSLLGVKSLMFSFDKSTLNASAFNPANSSSNPDGNINTGTNDLSNMNNGSSGNVIISNSESSTVLDEDKGLKLDDGVYQFIKRLPNQIPDELPKKTKLGPDAMITEKFDSQLLSSISIKKNLDGSYAVQTDDAAYKYTMPNNGSLNTANTNSAINTNQASVNTSENASNSGNTNNGISQNLNIYGYKNAESIIISGNSFNVYGHGWGHGLGMSQWGAKNMADSGKNFREILIHYYQGVVIESYENK